MAAAACGMCAYPRGEKGDVLWWDGSGSFALVAKRAPVGVVGHMMLVTARHVLNAASFDDVEAAALGPALRTASQAIVEATGAERIYTAALGSPKAPHFHAHLVPVYGAGNGADALGTPAEQVHGTPFDVFSQEHLAKTDPDTHAADADKHAEAARRVMTLLARR